jgi:predicted CXXCH cytochrome family protein
MVEHGGLKCLNRQKCMVTVFAGMTLFLILLTGCDRHTKHEVLTFFFTGVPPLEGNESQAPVALIVQSEVKKAEVRKSWPSIHGPYAAGECYQCHVLKGEQKEILQKGSFPNLQSLPKDLLIPKNELCNECHLTKSFAAAFTENLWIHGPVSAGMCTTCHHHHQSRYRYLLLKETSKQLCSQCHIEESITTIEEHMEDKECTFCHNPHLGKNRFLLKKDFFETY